MSCIQHDIILMKKQIISFFTAIVFSVSFMAVSPVSEGISAAVFEIASDEIDYDETLQLTDEVLEQFSVSVPSTEYLFNESTFSFYDQLDENNKAAYDAMNENWIVPSNEEFTITLAKSLSFTNSTSNIDNWTEEEKEEFWNTVLNAVYSAKNAFLFDHPEVFWIDEQSIGLSCSSIKTSRNFSGGYTIKVSQVVIYSDIKAEYTDVENAELCRQQVETELENFEVQGSDNYSKIKYIHDKIAETVVYNVEGIYMDSVYGFFCGPYEIVCEGYAKTFKLICDRENIPCILVVGNVNLTTNVAHMWNYVQMEDGEWYGVDCTWDDTDTASSPVKYTYFMKGSSGFGRHTPDSEYITSGFVYPDLCENDYVYMSSGPETTTTVSETETTSTVTVTVTETVSTAAAVTSTETNTSSVTETSTSETKTSSETSPVTSTVPVTTSVVTTLEVKGDYNQNGKLDSGDIDIVKDKLLGIEIITVSDLKHDMNSDGVINVYDFIIMKRQIERGIIT
ncbi:MAG: dockerin type I domain-containing protein [Porcipelethomonas sp.]